MSMMIVGPRTVDRETGEEMELYSDGRTKQAFKDETDVNKLLAKAQISGGLSHLEKHQGFYGDFADFDFQDAMLKLAKGRSIFEELPTELRKEFDQDPGKFFAFVNSPDNAERLERIFPDLAAPGRQLPQVSVPGGTRAVAPVAAPAAGSEAEPATPTPSPAEPVSE